MSGVISTVYFSFRHAYAKPDKMPANYSLKAKIPLAYGYRLCHCISYIT